MIVVVQEAHLVVRRHRAAHGFLGYILRIIKPVYPPVALHAGLKGTVILRVSVSETGRVTNIDVLKGAPGGLTEAAVVAVRGWRFEAATRDGAAVPGVITIPIPFEP